MTTFRRFTCDDLLTFTNVNLDHWTETYGFPFYMSYLNRWPEYATIAENASSGRAMGYSLYTHTFSTPTSAPTQIWRQTTHVDARAHTVIGKVEGQKELWHGHVTAVTVAPEARRLGLATELMGQLEAVTETHRGYFVDLFVRKGNSNALAMYHKLGYVEYRRVLGYYEGGEDAYDMRKSMSRDPDKKSMVPLTRPVRPEDLEWW